MKRLVSHRTPCYSRYCLPWWCGCHPRILKLRVPEAEARESTCGNAIKNAILYFRILRFSVPTTQRPTIMLFPGCSSCCCCSLSPSTFPCRPAINASNSAKELPPDKQSNTLRRAHKFARFWPPLCCRDGIWSCAERAEERDSTEERG